ncbi:MAG TPA: hypothetical protein VI566_01685 [Xanthomonadales bacterium]|nr:hypothetical protein [Xanthomonadales bacterium]
MAHFYHISRRFTWDVDYIIVTRLGGDPGNTDPPAAPTNLSASVTVSVGS